jgi:hypothetical protein
MKREAIQWYQDRWRKIIYNISHKIHVNWKKIYDENLGNVQHLLTLLLKEDHSYGYILSSHKQQSRVKEPAYVAPVVDPNVVLTTAGGGMVNTGSNAGLSSKKKKLASTTSALMSNKKMKSTTPRPVIPSLPPVAGSASIGAMKSGIAMGLNVGDLSEFTDPFSPTTKAKERAAGTDTMTSSAIVPTNSAAWIDGSSGINIGLHTVGSANSLSGLQSYGSEANFAGPGLFPGSEPLDNVDLEREATRKQLENMSRTINLDSNLDFLNE